MPENDAFIAGMSGVRFVRLMAELAGLPREHALERAHEAFFYVGLGEVRYRALGTYSLGMKQAAKLAQAIAHGPKLLFLDEPTNGLDPPARVRMIQLIQEIRDRGDLHLILSSHLLRDVEECCDEVLILKDGKVAAFCNLEEERRANRRFLEIETRGETNGLFLEAVEKLGCETAPGAQGRVKLMLPDGLEVRRLYEVAAEQNVQIRRLNHKRDSLEDIFLKAMEAPPMAVYKKTYRPYDGGLTSRVDALSGDSALRLRGPAPLALPHHLLHRQLHLPADLRAHHLRAAQRQRAGPGGRAGRQPADLHQRDVLHVAARLAEHAGAVSGGLHRSRPGVARPGQQRALALPGAALFAGRVRAGQALRPGDPDVADDLGAGPAAVRAPGLPGRLELDAGQRAPGLRPLLRRVDLDRGAGAAGAGAFGLGEVEARGRRPDVRRLLRGRRRSARRSTACERTKWGHLLNIST